MRNLLALAWEELLALFRNECHQWNRQKIMHVRFELQYYL